MNIVCEGVRDWYSIATPRVYDMVGRLSKTSHVYLFLILEWSIPRFSAVGRLPVHTWVATPKGSFQRSAKTCHCEQFLSCLETFAQLSDEID